VNIVTCNLLHINVRVLIIIIVIIIIIIIILQFKGGLRVKVDVTI